MPGIVPKLISGKPNLASVEAKIMSHCTTSLSQLLLSNIQDKVSAYQQGQLEAASELKAVSSIFGFNWYADVQQSLAQPQ
jgi:hypothetical protein